MRMKPELKTDTARRQIMKAQRSRPPEVLRWSGLTVLLCLGVPRQSWAATSWAKLVDAAPGGVENMLLLSDGTVMAHNLDTSNWFRLIPDTTGSYVNGTWTNMASMHDTRVW